LGRKSVKCDVCGNTFENKFQLKKHHQIHKRERPYLCETCGKSFSQSSLILVKHVENVSVNIVF
uniref:C2H2-type domain-containing protein n=1 Tax=Amphiprion ocellaris TaxID=80972 RepID=A0AAQ5XTC1_AMPOC